MDVLQLPTWLKQSSAAPRKSAAAQPLFPVNDELAARISLYEGDITKLQCDAVVNAANSQLLPGMYAMCGHAMIG